MATTSKEGSRRVNYSVLINERGSDNKYQWLGTGCRKVLYLSLPIGMI